MPASRSGNHSDVQAPLLQEETAEVIREIAAQNTALQAVSRSESPSEADMSCDGGGGGGSSRSRSGSGSSKMAGPRYASPARFCEPWAVCFLGGASPTRFCEPRVYVSMAASLLRGPVSLGCIFS